MEYTATTRRSALGFKYNLEEYLTYDGDLQIRKFMELYRVSYAEAQSIFEDTLRWLWMCAVKIREQQLQEEIDFMPFIHNPIVVIDKMWHTFILFTKDYQDFCQDNFGFFIHHYPSVKPKAQAGHSSLFKVPSKSRKEKAPKSQVVQMRPKQMMCVYELFGEETLDRWYGIYPKKYSRRRLQKLER